MLEQEVNNANIDQTEKLLRAFDATITKKFGHLRAPDPIVTPTGIVHLDTLLGGGLVSSGPIVVSSSPETGKSTFAFQFSSIFQQTYQNGLVVYLDLEGSSNLKTAETRISRIDTFGIDIKRFKYEPVVLTVLEVFDLIDKLIEIKKLFENKINKEFFILIVVDSISAARSSKTDDAESPDRIIGVKARQLSFSLDKYIPLLKFHKITFLCIDQVRADMKIDGPYAQKEQTVGVFKDIKSSIGTFTLQHNIQQWVFMSRKATIPPTDGCGIDGWKIDVFTEKNKLSPSKHSVTCIFDKNKGFDKFWSEHLFLSEVTPSEKKLYKDKNPPFPFSILKEGNKEYLEITDPNDPSITYKSGLFWKKDAKKKYIEDEIFKQWFDYAVQLSSYHRIVNGLFKINPVVIEEEMVVEEPEINEAVF